MKGMVGCSKCGRKRIGPICQNCGTYPCYVVIYWEGRHWRFRESLLDGEALDYGRALELLVNIKSRMQDKKKKFSPYEFMPEKIKECLLGNQALIWLADKKAKAEKNELSFETLKNYSGYVKNYFQKSTLSALDVRQIDYSHLNEFRDDLSGNLKIKTRRNIMNALHDLFRELRKAKIISSMPEFPSIAGEDAEVKIALTFAEQRGGLSKIPLPDRDVIEFGSEQGLRPGEICALKIGDVNLTKREVIIRSTWSGSRLRSTTKGKNKLPLPLSDRAYEIAKAHIKGRFDKDLFLFVHPRTGRPYRQKILNNFVKGTGLPCTANEFIRHSFCTQLIELIGAGGIDLKTAQRLMRHKHPATTLRWYTHTTSIRLRDAINRRSLSGDLSETAAVRGGGV